MLALAFGALLVATPAQAAGSSRIAAVQVALQARGLYWGTIDGYYGPGTQQAVVRFQRRRGLIADGIAGRRTRRSLGRYGRPLLGKRVLVQGRVGFDVSQLQFLLAWHGFPSGSFDGGFGGRTDHALRRFQRWARLGADGVAGPATFRALRTPPPRSPLRFVLPLQTGIGDRFGPRGSQLPYRDRLPGAGRNRRCRRALRPRLLCSLDARRLGLPRLDCTRKRGQDDVCAPLADRRARRRAGRRRPSDRPRRIHRPFHRPASPFRGQGARRRGRSATRLRLAPSSGSWPPGSRSGTRLARRPVLARGWPRSSSHRER